MCSSQAGWRGLGKRWALGRGLQRSWGRIRARARGQLYGSSRTWGEWEVPIPWLEGLACLRRGCGHCSPASWLGTVGDGGSGSCQVDDPRFLTGREARGRLLIPGVEGPDSWGGENILACLLGCIGGWRT